MIDSGLALHLTGWLLEVLRQAFQPRDTLHQHLEFFFVRGRRMLGRSTTLPSTGARRDKGVPLIPLAEIVCVPLRHFGTVLQEYV
jgi:hypothetical protein